MRHPPLPSALAAQTRFVTLGAAQVPALLAHPDWQRPAPAMLWIHGRTVSKELDNGRYLRWLRAGIATIAVDLPRHGERAVPGGDDPSLTLSTIAQMVREVDSVIEAIADPMFLGVFDLDRLGIGGMSAGGMVTLRRLCDEHPFRCAAVESTAGNLSLLYAHAHEHPAQLPPGHRPPWDQPEPEVRALDAMRHLEHWRPIPLLALHSRGDTIVPLACMSTFIDELNRRFPQGPAPILKTWPVTGSPHEHNGFGRVAAEAKTMQVDFLLEKLVK